MKAFNFRLARVRRAREIAERLARADWLEAEAAAVHAEGASDSMRTGIDHARRELSALQQNAKLNPDSILASDQALDRAWESLARQRRRASDHRITADQQRGIWSEKERERRALERLEDRLAEVHRTGLMRAEDAALDEWTSSRSRRRG